MSINSVVNRKATGMVLSILTAVPLYSESACSMLSCTGPRYTIPVTILYSKGRLLLVLLFHFGYFGTFLMSMRSNQNSTTCRTTEWTTVSISAR